MKNKIGAGPASYCLGSASPLRLASASSQQVSRMKGTVAIMKAARVCRALEKGGGTVTKVLNSAVVGVVSLAAVIELVSTVPADEAGHWDTLHEMFLTRSVNHQHAYSDEGACTNDAESCFSRLRRVEIGIHHYIRGEYLDAYVAEMAWREDNRRVSNGERYLKVTDAALSHPVSRQWKGYWHL